MYQVRVQSSKYIVAYAAGLNNSKSVLFYTHSLKVASKSTYTSHIYSTLQQVRGGTTSKLAANNETQSTVYIICAGVNYDTPNVYVCL